MGKLSNFAKWSITCLSVAVILACGGGDGGGSSSAFTTGDLAGDSRIIGVSVGGTNQGTLEGRLTIDSNGNVTHGEYTHAGTPGTINMTGGSVTLDSNGLFTGGINTDVGETSTILFGKLSASKSFASYVSSTNYGEYDLVTVIKSGGAFSQADFEGTWVICEISSGGNVKGVSNAAYDITRDGFFDGDNVMGRISLDSTGDFTGSGSLLLGGRVDIHGVMDRTRQLAVYVSIYTTGKLSLSIAIKSELSSFDWPDLAGTWYYTLANSGGAGEEISYGAIQMDTAARVIGGYYASASGDIPWTGGQFDINSYGAVFDDIQAADGAYFRNGGQMNISRNIMWLIRAREGPVLTPQDVIIAHKR